MSVTIKEIAEMAGVHRSTVDKVLHNRPGVSDPVRKRIQKIIDECNYQVNPIGKALKMQEKKFCIRVILLEVDALGFLKKGIEEAQTGYHTFHVEVQYTTMPYTDVIAQQLALKEAVRDRVDGIVLSPINTDKIAKEIDVCTDNGIPVITVNTDIKGTRRLCYIGQDGFKAGKMAGRLMGEFLGGKGKVAVFTSDGDSYQSFPFGTRTDGFRQLLCENYPEIEIMPDIYTKEQSAVIHREMTKLCQSEKNFNGIFITCGGVRAVGDVLEEYERKDVKFICYENYPEIMELLKKDIVTVTLDSEIEKQGKQSLEILLDFLIYERKPAKKHLYSETRILLKESL